MKLSVIIPTYNRREVLPRAIKSVLQQDGFSNDKVEVIVIDDGSSDGSDDMVARLYPQVKLLRQDNQGVSSARNLGIHQASGDWIALLDSDDEWLPHKLKLQCDLIERTALKVCHTQELWVRNGKRVNQMNKHEKAGGYIFERCLPLCAMSPSSILIHQSVFDKVGMFDDSLPACEDYDLWLKISAHFKVAYVERACIVKYGGHSDQLSRAFWGMDRFRVKALENLITNPLHYEKLSKQNQIKTQEILSKKNAILLAGASKRGNKQLEYECQERIKRLGL